MPRPTVLVLAASDSNLWPLRDPLLLQFGAQSLIERHLRQLRALGCERFAVSCGPALRGRIEAIGRELGAYVRFGVEGEPAGIVDALILSEAPLAHMAVGPVYVTDPYDVIEARLHAEMLDAWAQRPPPVEGLIAAVRPPAGYAGSYLTLEGGRITAVTNGPGPGSEPSGLIYLLDHAYAAARELCETVADEAENRGAAHPYESGLSRLMHWFDIRPVIYDGRWLRFDSPWRVLDLMDLLLDLWTREIESPGPDYERREGGVFIGRNVTIGPGAQIVGPALIGHGSVIGAGATVRASVLGPDCVVGGGAEVARSYLGASVSLDAKYVGDSVLDSGSAMGRGATTAHGKLGVILGAGAQVGANTNAAVGVKIGAGAIVGPNLRVSRDVPDRKEEE